MDVERQYLNYNEYKSLGGDLDQTPFNLLEFESRKQIDILTQGRLINLETLPSEIKMCMFNLINTINHYSHSNEGTNKNIASESVGSHSVSYVTGSQIKDVINSKGIEINDIITTSLFGVIVNGEHIIYLGVKQ